MLTPTRLTPKFNPAAPVPRRTLQNIIATGVGQAATRPLVLAAVLGTAGALAIILFLPDHWPLATPLICVACFGSWGLAAKQTQVLDLLHRRAPTLRFWLRLARTSAAAIGLAAAVIGILELFIGLIRPGALL
ncbi:MAG: hypothetical protein ACT4PJ_14780 [Gemmatimonadaceae bacterium]